MLYLELNLVLHLTEIMKIKNSNTTYILSINLGLLISKLSNYMLNILYIMKH